MDEHRQDTERFKSDVIGLNIKVNRLEEEARDIKEVREILHKLDKDLTRIDTKLRITWYFLSLIITGIIGIAFSLWQALGA